MMKKPIAILAFFLFTSHAFAQAIPVIGGLTNAGLKAKVITGLTNGVTIMRTGFSVVGDSPPVTYTFSTTACSLNTGAGDDGLQVKPAAGTGCWLGNLPTPADIRVWGCKGDNSTDNAACLNAAFASGVKHLQIPSSGIFRISGSLTATSQISLTGSYNAVGIYSNTCANGLRFTTANINAITFNAAGSMLSGLCIDYSVTNASGTAVTLSAGSNSSIVSNTQINAACIAVDVTGLGGTQNVGSVVDQNTINLPNNASCIGIRLGLTSTNGNTVNTKVTSNEVNCASNNGIALLVLDSGGLLASANVFGYQCGIGTKLFPGTNQSVIFSSFVGSVTGDTDSASDLFIDTNASNAVLLNNRFTGSWSSAASISPIVIRNTAGSLNWSGVDFVQHTVYVKVNQVGVDITGGTNIKIRDSQICSSGGANSTGVGISLGGNASNVMIQNNRIGDCDNLIGGTLPTGIRVTTSAYNIGMITGNNFANTATPISWSPTATTSQLRVTLKDNANLDDVSPSITTASSINAPINSNFFLNGAGTVNTISVGWQGRKIYMSSLSGTIVFDPTGGNVCNTVTMTLFQSVTATYNAGINCWLLK